MSDSTPTPTDVLKLAISNTIESHRLSLDAMTGLAQVQIIVNYDTRRGRPGKITIKPEMVTMQDGSGEQGK